MIFFLELLSKQILNKLLRKLYRYSFLQKEGKVDQSLVLLLKKGKDEKALTEEIIL